MGYASILLPKKGGGGLREGDRWIRRREFAKKAAFGLGGLVASGCGQDATAGTFRNEPQPTTGSGQEKYGLSPCTDGVVVYGNDSTRTSRAAAVQDAVDRARNRESEKTCVVVPPRFLDYDAFQVRFDEQVPLVRPGQAPGVYDVRAYGAAGDGITDDTAACQAAVDAARRNNDTIEYLPGGGGVELRRGFTFFPAGIYLVTGLTEVFAPLVGASPSSSAIKHRGDEGASEIVTVGDGGDTWVYDFLMRDLTLVGDGDLERNSGAETGNVTRVGIRVKGGIWKCSLENVTISQCQIGAEILSSWTLSLENLYVFNCSKCLVWEGGSGTVEDCRFDAVYNPAAGSSDHCLSLRRDPDTDVNIARMLFDGCSFQGAGKAGVWAGDVMQLGFRGCLFERNNKSDEGYGYVEFVDEGVPVPVRMYTFENCLWTPAGDQSTSSVAVACENADSIQFIGSIFQDSTGVPFANSISTAEDCEVVVFQGTVDNTSRGKALDPETDFLCVGPNGFEAGGSHYQSRSTRIRGDLVVNRDGEGADARTLLTGDANQRQVHVVQTNGQNRWAWGAGNDAESEREGGSSWILVAYDDSGTEIDRPLRVDRSTDGAVVLSRPLRLHVLTDVNRPLPGEEGRLIFSASHGNLYLDDGQNWIPLLSSTANRETLSGDKTLSRGDARYQNLDPGGNDRFVTLPEPAPGVEFLIANRTEDSERLEVRDERGMCTLTLKKGEVGTLLSDGTGWTAFKRSGSVT